jgi:hypothetical protein
MASNFKNAGMICSMVDNSTADVYTCPPSPATSRAVLHAVYLSNTSLTSVANCDIKVTVDGGTTFRHIGKSLEVAAQNTLILDKPVNLEASDIIRVVADVTHLEVFLSILEVT